MKLFKFVLLFLPFITLAQGEDDFKLCGEGIMHPYYYPELMYDGDFIAILSHFKDDFNSEKHTDLKYNSGILTIQFHVNCKGETGDFSIKMVDFDFKGTKINQEMVDEILNFTKGLNKWIPAKDEDGLIVNSHKFLSFKIVNSNITEIFPK